MIKRNRLFSSPNEKNPIRELDDPSGFSEIKTLKKQMLKMMLLAFILASTTSIIYAIVDKHVFYSFLPHFFVIPFYSFMLYKVTKKCEANIERIAVISLLIYAFALFPPTWVMFSYSHPMVVVVAVFISIMSALLFEGKTKKIIMNLILSMMLVFFILDIVRNFLISTHQGRDYLGMGVGILITAGMVVICVNGFKNKFLKMSIRLHQYSIMDSLTGAYNSRKMNELLEEFIEAYNSDGEIFSVAMIDMDKFKRINDTYGHNVGDTLLKQTVEVMQNNLRTEDVLARYGGDEFVVLIPNCNAEEAKEIIERLLIAVGKIETDDNVGGITFSAGVSDIREASNSKIDIFKLADMKLYNAKESGRNMVFENLFEQKT